MAEAPFSDEDSIPSVVPLYEDISSSPKKADSEGSNSFEQSPTFHGSLRGPPANGKPGEEDGNGEDQRMESSSNSSCIDEDLEEQEAEEEGEEELAASSPRTEDVDGEKQLTKCFEELTTASVPFTPVPKYKNVQEDEDGSDESSEEETRKKVRVGNHYQARIPKLSTSDHVIDKTDEDELLWNPHGIEPTMVDAYLGQVSSRTSGILPMGSHVRDGEEALYVLHQCKHNTDDALAALERGGGGSSTLPPSPKPPPSPRTAAWSDEECRSFERGFVRYGKNFYMIQRRNLNSRSVGELVQFYYLWKKSERYDLYAAKVRANKKKYTLNPGVPDLTHKYLHVGSVKRPPPNGGYDMQVILKSEAKKPTKVAAAADDGAQY